MKLAIVQDELVRRGGSEQVCLAFHRAYPDAPIYTSSYNPELTYPEFKATNVKTSWFNKIAQDEHSLKRYFFPFGVMAMKQLDLTQYDVILISATHWGKYVKVNDKALVITYCHFPFRLAWASKSYKEFENSNFLKKGLLSVLIKILQKIDFKAAQRTDWYIGNSPRTKQLIEEIYKPKREVGLIFPPVNLSNFSTSSNSKEYYLVVSRFEFYKKVDLVIDAFNELGLPLIIVGKGSQEAMLKDKAKDNIEFRSEISKEELNRLYANCKALIFPQLEDYGITPLEANASGRPVIAFGKGGVTLTQIPVKEKVYNKATAIFFEQQEINSLLGAVKEMEESIHLFDEEFILANAARFKEEIFIEHIQAYINERLHTD